LTQITLDELQRLVGYKPLQSAFHRAYISDRGSYQEFIKQLYLDIDESVYYLQSTRHDRQNDSEDRISLDILMSLSRLGYEASHDKKSGGHVDLDIQLGSHAWMGEAKKDGNIKEGLLQLTTRYVQSSGNFKHDQGGLLYYMVKTSDALGKLKAWHTDLTNNGCICTPPDNSLSFYSTHKLDGSGTDFIVRTMAVSLYHAPQDKSARISATKKAKKSAS
jgi:hypothetical protein